MTKADKLRNNEEIDTIDEDNIICPYCGYVIDQDLEEYFQGDEITVIKCVDCNQEFKARIKYNITFFTERINENKENYNEKI